MTPIQDISIAIEQGTYDDLSGHSIRDRMRYIDHAINDVISTLHLFIGPKRTEAFYEQQADASVPKATRRIEDVLMVLKSIKGKEPMPTPPGGPTGPRRRRIER